MVYRVKEFIVSRLLWVEFRVDVKVKFGFNSF